MKVEIKNDGYIWITAETPTEAFAIKHLENEAVEKHRRLAQSGDTVALQNVPAIVLDLSVLNHE